MLKNSSLRRKLELNNVYVTLISFSILGGLVYYGLTTLSSSFADLSQQHAELIRQRFEYQSESNIKKIAEIYKKDMEKKGQELIQKDSLSVASMMEDNSFQSLRKFLRKTLENDPDILVASFHTTENKLLQAWQYVSTTYKQGLVMPIEYDHNTKSWISTYQSSSGGHHKVVILDPMVTEFQNLDESYFEHQTFKYVDEMGKVRKVTAYVCVTPIFPGKGGAEAIRVARDKGEAIGYLRYIISPIGMEKAIAEQKLELEKAMVELQIENERSNLQLTKTASSSWQGIAFLMLLGFVGMIGVSLFLSRRFGLRLIKPVTELTEVAEKMSDGNYSQDIAVHSDDEIGILANSFRRMSIAITKRDEELAEINCNLEKLVEQRTEQLNEQLTLVSDLLNNMKQAVFSVSADAKVVAPVSQFTESLFGGPIVGHDIFDLIYNGINSKNTPGLNPCLV
jgi:HAMP domain-containing protein